MIVAEKPNAVLTPEKPVAAFSMHGVRFLLGLVCGLLMGLMAWEALILAKPYVLPESGAWTNGIIERKLGAADHVRGNKVVFLGGSGTHYGVSAEQFYQATKVPAINFGTYAGLELSFMLDTIKPVLKRGDMVVILLEYSFYTVEQQQFSDGFIDVIVSGSHERFFNNFTWAEQQRFILSESPDFLVRSAILKVMPSISDYHAESVNAFGDETANHDKFHNPDALAHAGIGVELDKVKLGDFSTTTIEAFLAWCKDQGVTVVASYPNMMASPVIDGKYDLPHPVITGLYAKHGIEVIGKPSDFVYPQQYFLDTPYHMVQSGVKLRTDELSTRLQPYLNAHHVRGTWTTPQ